MLTRPMFRNIIVDGQSPVFHQRTQSMYTIMSMVGRMIVQHGGNIGFGQKVIKGIAFVRELNGGETFISVVTVRTHRHCVVTTVQE